MTRSLSAVLLAISLGSAVSGCASDGLSDPRAPLTPLSRYSLQVEPGLDRIALAVHNEGLSANQRAAVAELAGRYSVSGAGAIRIETPAGDDPVSAGQAYAIRTALLAAGVPGERIQMAAYFGPDPRSPVLAGFEVLRARIPNCSLEPHDLGRRFSNQSSPGFGCAITANMAAQIADPRDILGARPMTPADSGRAAVVFDNYRKGQASSTPQEPLVNGKIARAVE